MLVEPAQGLDGNDIEFDADGHLAPAVEGGTIQEWWIPERVFVDDMPLTATGKFNKNVRREQYGDVLS